MSDCSYPDANRRADELETLFNIQQAITRQLDIEAVLQLIADEARRLTGSRRTAVFLLEGDTARIAVVSGEPHSMNALGYRMPVTGSLISEAIQSQTPIFMADAQHDPHVQADPRRLASPCRCARCGRLPNQGQAGRGEGMNPSGIAVAPTLPNLNIYLH